MIKILLFLTIPVLVSAQTVPLNGSDAVSRLELHGVAAEITQYRGQSAIRLTETPGNKADSLATIREVSFHNGTLDVDVAGAPASGAGEFARGFIGIAFHLATGGTRFECIYIRPTNARSDDQLRRNHTIQYLSFPDWPWERLRRESPGVYESYTDMAAGEWTHLRIVVSGTLASLYVGNASQPCLLVHDLKLGDSAGAIALWIGPGTDGYFRNLTIRDAGKR